MTISLTAPRRWSVCALSNTSERLVRSSSQANIAEQPENSGDDKVSRDDIVQQARHDQDEGTGHQRYQGRKAQGDVHGVSFVKCALCSAIKRSPRCSS